MSDLCEYLKRCDRWVLLSVAAAAVGIEVDDALRDRDVYLEELGEFIASADNTLPIPPEFQTGEPVKHGELMVFCREPRTSEAIEAHFAGVTLTDPDAKPNQSRLITFTQLAERLVRSGKLIQANGVFVQAVQEGEERYVLAFPRLEASASNEARAAIEKLHRAYPRPLSEGEIWSHCTPTAKDKSVVQDRTVARRCRKSERVLRLLVDDTVAGIASEYVGLQIAVADSPALMGRVAIAVRLPLAQVRSVVRDLVEAEFIRFVGDELHGWEPVRESEGSTDDELLEPRGLFQSSPEKTQAPESRKVKKVPLYELPERRFEGERRGSIVKLWEAYPNTLTYQELGASGAAAVMRRSPAEGTAICRYKPRQKATDSIFGYIDQEGDKLFAVIPSGMKAKGKKRRRPGRTVQELVALSGLPLEKVEGLLAYFSRIGVVRSRRDHSLRDRYFRADAGDYKIKIGGSKKQPSKKLSPIPARRPKKRTKPAEDENRKEEPLDIKDDDSKAEKSCTPFVGDFRFELGGSMMRIGTLLEVALKKDPITQKGEEALIQLKEALREYESAGDSSGRAAARRKVDRTLGALSMLAVHHEGALEKDIEKLFSILDKLGLGGGRDA